MKTLPTGWTTAPLDELVEVLDSQRKPVNAKERAQRPGKVPYYGAAGPVGTIDEALFDEPLVLLGEDGVQFFDQKKPKAYLIDGPAWVNNHAHVLRPLTSLVDRRYLKYYLDAFDYNGYANGTTRLKLTKRAMASIPVTLPPREEQGRIANKLDLHFSMLDNVLDDLEALLGLLKRAQSRVIEAGCQGKLTSSLGGGDAEAELTLGLGLSPDAPDEPVPVLPEGWVWTTLGSLSQVAGGVTKDAKKQDDPAFVEVPYLRVANVQAGQLLLDEVSRIRVSASQALSLRLQAGDVLMNEGGDRDKLGRGWVWEDQVKDCIHQNHVFRVRVRGGVLEPKFLSWHGNTYGRTWFQANGKQTTNLASISLSNLKRLPVPVPPRTEQRRIIASIENHLRLLDEAEVAVRALQVRATTLKRALLGAAFSGELLPRVASDQPRNALLARTRTQAQAEAELAHCPSGAQADRPIRTRDIEETSK